MTVREQIEAKLDGRLAPVHLEVTDESYMHAVSPNAESHFSVVAAADTFEGLSLVDRHRVINRALREEFQQGLHALAIQAFSSAEWNERQAPLKPSPPCLGGSKETD